MSLKTKVSDFLDSDLHEYLIWLAISPELALAKFAFDNPDYIRDVCRYMKYRWVARNCECYLCKTERVSGLCESCFNDEN